MFKFKPQSPAAKGRFTVAVPGGSVLKMLSGLASEPSASAIDWKKVWNEKICGKRAARAGLLEEGVE